MSISAEMPAITGVILAGGQARRMGGEDKGLIAYRGKPLFQHVLARLQPQVTSVMINANRNLATYQHSGLRVFSDTLLDFPGPLAGMLAALVTAETEWVAFAACDTPALPDNYVMRLWQMRGVAPVVWVCDEERDHPMLALMHVSLVEPLRDFLANGERRVMQFFKQAGGHSVMFNDSPHAFVNINNPSELI